MASSGGVAAVIVVALELAVFAFGLFTAQPANMRGSSRMLDGVKYFPARSATPSRSSLWRAVTRPPRLQSKAWQMEKVLLQSPQ